MLDVREPATVQTERQKPRQLSQWHFPRATARQAARSASCKTESSPSTTNPCMELNPQPDRLGACKLSASVEGACEGNTLAPRQAPSEQAPRPPHPLPTTSTPSNIVGSHPAEEAPPDASLTAFGADNVHVRKSARYRGERERGEEEEDKMGGRRTFLK